MMAPVVAPAVAPVMGSVAAPIVTTTSPSRLAGSHPE